MKKIKDFRLFIGFSLSVISLVSGLHSFFVEPSLVLVRNSGVQSWEARMKPVKLALPKDVQELGYVSDLDLLINPTQEQLFTEVDEFPLTMYSMTPRNVQQGLGFEWIIGNFTKPGFKDYLDTNLPNGYELQSMGFGIYLIRNNAP